MFFKVFGIATPYINTGNPWIYFQTTPFIWLATLLTFFYLVNTTPWEFFCEWGTRPSLKKTRLEHSITGSYLRATPVLIFLMVDYLLRRRVDQETVVQHLLCWPLGVFIFCKAPGNKWWLVTLEVSGQNLNTCQINRASDKHKESFIQQLFLCLIWRRLVTKGKTQHDEVWFPHSSIKAHKTIRRQSPPWQCSVRLQYIA